MRQLVIIALLGVAACNKAPDPAATASAHEIDLAVAKAVRDTDAATDEAAIGARSTVMSEPMSR